MSFAANTLTITGNLTRQPETRVSPSGGQSRTIFGIAYNERRKNQQTGQWDERPHFFEVTVFGGQGEWIAQNLGKGDPITIVGSLEQRRWQDQQGQNRELVSIIARDVMPGQRAHASRQDSPYDPGAVGMQQSYGQQPQGGYASAPGYGQPAPQQQPPAQQPPQQQQLPGHTPPQQQPPNPYNAGGQAPPLTDDDIPF